MRVDVLGLWTISVLPLPMVLGAGVVLAIASNRTAQIRISSQRQSSDAVQSSRDKHTAPSQPGRSSSIATQQEPQLPTFERPPSSTKGRPISFMIRPSQTNDRHDGS